MKHELPEHSVALLKVLSGLPRRMTAVHGYDAIADLVLHELSCDGCFGFKRAAYLIDNPDFDCLQGVAGYCSAESFQPVTDAWQDVDRFSSHISTAPFNQKVRALVRPSFRRRGASDNEVAGALAGELGMQEHGFQAWNMRNDNRGILVFESSVDHPADLLESGVSLLSFCPVF